MNSTKHSPEPWRIHRLNNGWPVITSDAHDIADLRLNGNGLARVEANARRIAAAVNACQGISSRALERGIVAELLQQLMLLADHLETPPHNLSDKMRALRLQEARATIAKANGRTA
jgi:hypothetical protein